MKGAIKIITQFPSPKKSASKKAAEPDEVRIQLDLKFDLPGSIAEKLEQFGVTKFEKCRYDRTRRVMYATVKTTLYSEGA